MDVNTTQNEQETVKLQDILYLCLKNWYWFVISLALCVGAGVFYLLTTAPVYTTNASILIKNDSKGQSSSSEFGSFADMGLFTTKTNVNNEMQSLSSPDLMQEVVKRLSLNTDYRVEGKYRKRTVYGDELPVTVSYLGDSDASVSSSMSLAFTPDSTVTLSDFRLANANLDMPAVTGSLNDTLNTPVGALVVRPTASYGLSAQRQLLVYHSPARSAVAACSKRLTVKQNDEKSDVISLSFTDVSTRRGEDVLNALITVYNENWVKDKNQIAVSTSMFINDRIVIIENELGNVDSDISSYKSQNLLPDVNAAASLYMTKEFEANSSIQELNNQAYMARYIRNYLLNEANKFELLPVSSGINNQNIAQQIAEYNNILRERNTLVSHSSTKNPLVIEMDSQLAAMRSALNLSIDNQLVALNAQISSQQGYSTQMKSKIASNPNQARYLLSVERQQKVKESLYLYLLQKREENELSQAFTAYNTRIVRKPESNIVPTSPISRNILLICIFLGLLIPAGIIFLIESFNTKVRGRKDLDALNIPFAGEIPQWKSKSKTKEVLVVKEGSRNVVNEAFRVLRTNIEFMGKTATKSPSKVIIVTASNSSAGKSFVSLNIAMSLAIKKKKVLIVDADLRHASSSVHVGSPKTGISNYLSGNVSSTAEIIYQHGDSEYLHILPVGTIPPNPTELLEHGFAHLIEELRADYDYIIVDCAPIDIVADTQIIESVADITLFVIRAGLEERSMLGYIESLYKGKRFNNMAIVLNGTQGSSRYSGGVSYRYGYRYGYHYGYY